ncbi:hypothetical protein P7H17_16550 [Paenibacillus larvae]|nr:hypothetical protein [Paenibacillus larvae]MDT2287318.1 hypothetical protein [Paenibacillus larvae]
MYRQIQEGVIAAQDMPDKVKSSSKTKKEERIESLEPLIESFLRFNRSHRLLLEQMEQFREVHTMTCRTHWPGCRYCRWKEAA